MEIISTDNDRGCNFYLLQGNLLWGLLLHQVCYSSGSIDVKGSAALDNIRPVASTDDPHQFQHKEGKIHIYDNDFEKKNKTRLYSINKSLQYHTSVNCWQKSRDVANLDICTGVLFSFLCCCFSSSKVMKPWHIPFLSFSIIKKKGTVQHESMSSVRSYPSPGGCRMTDAKTRAGYPPRQKGFIVQ